MGNWRADFYAVDGGLTLAALPAPNGILWNCPHVLTQKIAAPAFTAEVTLDARALQIGEQAGFGLIGGQYAYIALRRTAAGMRLVFVQSDGEAHQERVCEEIDAPAEPACPADGASADGRGHGARGVCVSASGELAALRRAVQPCAAHMGRRADGAVCDVAGRREPRRRGKIRAVPGDESVTM